MLMQLGSYQFELNTALYQTLKRNTEYRWSKRNRFGKNPALQYVGEGADDITLEGVIYPEFRGGDGQIDQMRALAKLGKPQLMVAGDGYVYGFWAMGNIEETQAHITKFGPANKQTFIMELSFYGDRA